MASQLLGIKTRFTNDLGSPLVGGQVYTYFAGTSTNQDSYSDAALTVPNTNPVILDDTGSADIFLKGSYRIRVFDASGRFIEEQDNVSQPSSSTDVASLTGRVITVEERTSMIGVVYNTLSTETAKLLNIKDDVTSIRTQRFSDVDKGGALYARSTALEVEPHSPLAWFQSADGTYWLMSSDFITPEMFGAIADGVADDIQAFSDAVETASKLGKIVILPSKNYRMSTTFEIKYPITMMGLNKSNNVTLDISNTEEGFFVNASNVTLENFTITANSITQIANGTGHKGTCVTISAWFTAPDLPEPPLIKNTTIRRMNLNRQAGSQSAHAIAIMARTSGVVIDNCDFEGGGNSASTGMHSNAVLTHWGAHQHGVSTNAIDVTGVVGTFTAGSTITATTGATAYIVDVDVTGSTAVIFLKEVSGAFTSGGTVTTGSASASISVGSYVSLRQARFEPMHYSFHPNNVRVTNCRIRNTARLIACSASYDIDVSNIDYMGGVQGGQLIDLPIGDEGSTFAHPDDSGRVYEGFSFRNIRAKNITGSGANAVTVIDASGFCTSKQSDVDLAAYASAPYTTESYAGVAQGRRRSFEWKNVVIENLTFDAGASTPPSSTPYVRMLYLRNLEGQFSFKNIYAIGRDNVLSLELVNCIGNYTFTDCKFLGGVNVNSTEGAKFVNCEIRNPQTLSGTVAVLVGGTKFTCTNSSTLVSGATTIPLSTPLDNTRILVGQQITYAGGLTYCSKYYEKGDTEIHVEPLKASAASGTTFTIDQTTKDTSFTGCDIRGGDEGYDISNAVISILQGTVRDTGHYGILVNEGADVTVSGVSLANNGIRKVVDDTLATRDIGCSGVNKLSIHNCIFRDSKLISTNIAWGTTTERLSISDCTFLSTPLSSRFSSVELANGTPIWFKNNVDSASKVITLFATVGTNANGSWVKHENGTLECWARNVTIGAASPYVWTFPTPFIDTGTTFVTATGTNGTTSRVGSALSTSATTANVWLTDNNSTASPSAATAGMSLYAKGFWK